MLELQAGILTALVSDPWAPEPRHGQPRCPTGQPKLDAGWAGRLGQTLVPRDPIVSSWSFCFYLCSECLSVHRTQLIR